MDQNNAIQQIKDLLFMDRYCCPDCDWHGSMNSLISSKSKRSKLCPNCNSLQFSKQDPTLRQRLDSAESLLLRLKVMGEISSWDLSYKTEKQLILKSLVKTFKLDEDGVNDLNLRIQDLK